MIANRNEITVEYPSSFWWLVICLLLHIYHAFFWLDQPPSKLRLQHRTILYIRVAQVSHICAKSLKCHAVHIHSKLVKNNQMHKPLRSSNLNLYLSKWLIKSKLSAVNVLGKNIYESKNVLIFTIFSNFQLFCTCFCPPYSIL